MRHVHALLGSCGHLECLGDGVLASLLPPTDMDLSPEERVEFTTILCCSRSTRTCDIIMLNCILKTHSSWWSLFVSPFVRQSVLFC